MNIETAGVRLKKIRQERGLALEDIAKKTKMHLNVLRAIEGDTLSDLSPVYLKGFIKIYCNHLGLDPQDYIGESTPTLKPVLHATVGRGLGERSENKSTFVKDATVKLNTTFAAVINFKRWIVILILLVVVIFIGQNIFKFVSGRFKNPVRRAKIILPALNVKTVKEKLPKEAKGVTAAKNTAVLSKSAKDDIKGFSFEIFARSKTWVSAKVDGKLRFHGFLTPGRSEAWRAQEKIELSLGDAGAVEIQVNDQRFARLGRRGQSLKNILINKDGLKTS